MKLKELERPAVQVWSPSSQHPIYLATGTSAQQLDASFSTNATLEIFEVDFRDPSLDLKHKGALSASSRFHKLIWGNFSSGSPEGSGVIAGGGDNGVLTLYSVSQILSLGKEPLIAQKEKHTGAVRALDFNPFQSNLLASGANDSEIYIWDLNNFSVPMTPGSKSQQPPEDVSALSWNQQVQHILSSAHPSGKAVVWDLRKNEPIIKVSDHSNRMHCSGLAWHPEVATQLVLCSEDDRLPVIQMWDLRFASSPLKVLDSHSRGVLSVSWSQADPELLLSSAKDNQILCWNLGSGEVVYKLPTQNRWCFDVQWCPRNPPVFSAASFNGWISLYSVMGGNWEAQQKTQAEKISSSFSSLDPFGIGHPLPPLEVPEQVAHTNLIPPLKKPPKWIRRPTGASFAFGGKLVTFGLPSPPTQQVSQPGCRLIFISQVITESELLARSQELQEALGSGSLLHYCQSQIQRASLPSEKNIWQFLKVTLEQESRTKFLKLLGYSKEELYEKMAARLGSGLEVGESPHPTGGDLCWNRQAFCRQGSRHSSEESAASSAFFDELVPQNMTPLEIPVTEDTDGLLSQALLLGELGHAVELCLKEERFADAIILAGAGGEQLLRKTQQRYFAQKKSRIASLLACTVEQKWRNVACSCSLKSWKEALALLLTYCGPQDFPELCDMLGNRLEQEGGETLAAEACLCYICSGNVERLVECWVKIHQTSSPMALQDLVEKVMVLSRSPGPLQRPEGAVPGPATAHRVTQYASLLAAQGSLATAMSYLPKNCAQPLVQQLRDRLFHAQGSGLLGQQPPPFPFPRVTVGSSPQPRGLGAQPHATGLRPLAQVSAPPPGPGVFMSQLSAPMTLSHPSTYQSPRPPSTRDSRAAGARLVPPPLPGPRAGAALPQPQLLGVQQTQAPGPVGFPGTQPFPGPPPPMAPQTLSFPGSTFLAGAPGLSTSLPSWAPGPGLPPPIGSQAPVAPISFPVTCCPPGGPGAPVSRTLPASGILDPHSGPREPCRDTSASKGGLQRTKLPEMFTPPAPITAPIGNLPLNPREARSPGPPISGMGQAPPGAPGELSLQQLQQLPPEQVKKKEMPPEHQPLKTSFEALLRRCTLSAFDPKTKRKLEEVALRLEYLYEKLQEGMLSPNVLAGLHEVSRCVDAGSYEQALAVHTQVVGSSSFSEVSGFMPALKTILTIAHKLQGGQ
ncbi:protein transport protein Sec31B isoform X1 [Antechinus flavipes]|uniref:protein transport protein Sec31B isoform X1 n=1 Tax=Antechinus flavipes TaxID=38775 RepID=UPI0022356F3C|nr:protein transport protein Sec31B isoform X1 [Antechinus flavipes]XP_051837180.1 protein transport protein Sec31B isoform X1 [Antechinus flavipes]